MKSAKLYIVRVNDINNFVKFLKNANAANWNILMLIPIICKELVP